MMYLNFIVKFSTCSRLSSLTVTYDVFKSAWIRYFYVISSSLTVTYDVFKYLIPINLKICFGRLTVTYDVFK